MTHNPLITDDASKLLAMQLSKFGHSIQMTTGCKPEIIVWPKGVPLYAMRPGLLMTWNGIAITGPYDAITQMNRFWAD